MRGSNTGNTQNQWRLNHKCLRGFSNPWKFIKIVVRKYLAFPPYTKRNT